MFKVRKMYLCMMFFWSVLTVFSFAAESAASGPIYKVGFEFQESNHLFNQGNDRDPQLLHQSLIKTPLFSVNYKGQRIFHVEADDYDLEIITIPFSSRVEHSDFLVESFRILQTFVDRIYEFLGESEEAKNLDDFIKRIAGSIRDKTYFTELDDKRYGGSSLKSADHNTLGLEPEKEEGVLRTIRLYKKPDFTPGFKPQFSVQTNLTNFILSYFYLFHSGGGVQPAPMAAMQAALAGRKLEDEGRIIDPVHNFIALYLYTCISPRIVRDREGGGGTLLSTMISAHQCDYKMFLPLMSRVSFSSLSAGIGDWKAAMAAQWPRETFEQYQTVGDHEFGDFYDSRLTSGLKEKLTPTIEVDGGVKPDSDLPLIRAALDEGIITTHILKKLDERAFSTPDDRGRANEYVSRYGQHVFDSIGHPENEHMRLELKEEEKSCILSFQRKRSGADLFSPPFLSQEGNSMGTFDITLDPQYGNFLFEIRAAHRLGMFIKREVLLNLGVANTRDFLQLPSEIGSHSVALMKALDLVYNRKGDKYGHLIRIIGEFK